jgi:hypothetical protein
MMDAKIKQLQDELEKAYKANDIMWIYEIFNEIYCLRTKIPLAKPLKLTVKDIIRMERQGQMAKLSDIQSTLEGLIELAIAPLQ